MLPPILLIIKKYNPTPVVRKFWGTSSTITLRQTPTHISPITYVGIKNQYEYGGLNINTQATNGAATNYLNLIKIQFQNYK